MFGSILVQSDDFQVGDAPISFGHIILYNAQTNKRVTCSLNLLKTVQVIDEEEILSASADIKRFTTNFIVGGVLVSAGVLPALATLLIGHNLPDKTKSRYLAYIEFTDGKSAILQTNQKKHDLLMKYQ